MYFLCVFYVFSLRFICPFSKPSSRSLLVDEQSDTWPLLRGNDRKSRHRRIKKQRRYERLAATSQLSLWYGKSQCLKSTSTGSEPGSGCCSCRTLSCGPDYILRHD